MIFDKENLMSEDQALTTTAVSENVIDLGLTEMGEGEPIEIIVQVTADLATGTSVQIDLETDDNASFSSAVVLQASGVIATASLKAGYRFTFSILPQDAERYIRLNYVIIGTFDAGTVTAGLALDRDTWKALPDAL